MHYVSMMWRFSVIMLFASCILNAQTKPVPPPPPPPPPLDWYTPPTQEELLAQEIERHDVMDELLNSMEYYHPKDLVYHESSTAKIMELKLKSARVVGMVGDTILSNEIDEEVVYNEQGLISKTIKRSEGFEEVRKWNYTKSGKVKLSIRMSDFVEESGKHLIGGDSIVITYLGDSALNEIKRYSFKNKGATRSSTLISIRKFTYNPNGTLKQRTEDGFTYYYFYDKDKRPIRITSSLKSVPADSFAYTPEGADLRIQHWIIGYNRTVLTKMEEQLVNVATGNLIEYKLFAEGKFNFIRSVTGPMSLKYVYDVQNRCISQSYYNGEGKLIAESAYEYFNGNLISKFRLTTFWSLNEENSIENYPPFAQQVADYLYEVYELNYEKPNDGEMPNVGNLNRHLVSVRDNKREILASKPGSLKIKVICTYY